MNFYLKKANISLLVCLSFCFHTASAEYNDEYGDSLADFYGDEEFVSIATGTKQLITKAPAVASVITSEDIKALGARNISDVLQTVPGLYASRSGQQITPEFWFRGITSTYNPQTLFMINGVSIKSVVRGDNHTVWGEFPIHAIERIEIIRGPGSARYGADAFSGVINVITKQFNPSEKNNIGGMYGSFNTSSAWTNLLAKFSHWELAMNLELTKSDGFDAVIESDAQTLVDNFAAQMNIPAASLAPGKMPTGFEALDAWFTANHTLIDFDLGLQLRDNVEMGQGATEVLDPKGKLASKKLLAKISLKEQSLRSDWYVNALASFYNSTQEVTSNLHLFPERAFFGAFPGGFIGNPEWNEETSKLEVSLRNVSFESTEISFGAGYERQNLYEVREEKNFFPDLSPRPEGLVDVSDTSEVFIPEADRENTYAYLQFISQLAPDWELTAGARFDNYSDFGNTLNPRVALVWSTSLKLTSKLLYGKAFRAPAFAETMVVNNPVSLGNAELDPETIDTLELAFNYGYSNNLNLDFNLFHYKAEDFISFVSDGNGVTATAQNIGKRSGIGGEAAVTFVATDNLKLSGNMAYVKAKDDLNKRDVGDYPSFQSYFRADWETLKNLRLNIQVFSIGSRERNVGDGRESLSGYQQVNLSANYNITEYDVHFDLLISNLFDDNIKEPSSNNRTLGEINIPYDIPQAGRAIYVKLTKFF